MSSAQTETVEERVRSLVDKKKVEQVQLIDEELSKKYDLDKLIESYCETRGKLMMDGLLEIAKKDGGIPQLTAYFQQFYTSGEFVNLQNIWLMATQPEYRPHVLKVLGPLYVAGDLLAALLDAKQKKGN